MLEEGEFKLKKEFTEEEQEFWKECYKVGMQNNWMNGGFDRLDGNPIVEDDRLNTSSVIVIETIERLRKFFVHGNQCLGSSVIYKNLCFMNQVNGGDEWLVIKKFKNGTVRDFESYTLGPEARAYQGEHDSSYLDPLKRHLIKDNPELLRQEFITAIKDLTEARLYSIKEKKNIPEINAGKLAVNYTVRYGSKEDSFNSDYEAKLISE